MLPLILVPRHPPPNSKYLSLAPEHFRGIYLVHHKMSKTNLETMNLVFCIKMSLPYFLPERSRLGYTLFYAGSEHKVKIREMKFLRILLIFLKI